jgi:hypothetical protein
MFFRNFGKHLIDYTNQKTIIIIVMARRNSGLNEGTRPRGRDRRRCEGGREDNAKVDLGSSDPG